MSNRHVKLIQQNMTNQKMDRKEYIEERKFLAELEAEAYRGFDKTLLALSSGAILLSMNFIANFHRIPCSFFLILAWVSWILSIFSQLASYIVTSKAMREELNILNEQYRDNPKEARKNRYGGIATKLNIAALSTFAFGVLMFFIFVVTNLVRV